MTEKKWAEMDEIDRMSISNICIEHGQLSLVAEFMIDKITLQELADKLYPLIEKSKEIQKKEINNNP